MWCKYFVLFAGWWFLWHRNIHPSKNAVRWKQLCLTDSEQVSTRILNNNQSVLLTLNSCPKIFSRLIYYQNQCPAFKIYLSSRLLWRYLEYNRFAGQTDSPTFIACEGIALSCGNCNGSFVALPITHSTLTGSSINTKR